MTKVNPEFIKEMQAALDRKATEYNGKDNPKNYKNMSEYTLKNRLHEKMRDYFKFRLFWNKYALRKLLVAISNLCWMLWERLEEE